METSQDSLSFAFRSEINHGFCHLTRGITKLYADHIYDV